MSEHGEMPVLWWSPTGGLIRGGTNGGYDDAERLVRAPVAPAVDGLLQSLDHLVEMWARGRTYSGSGRPEDDLASTLRRFREGHDVTPKVAP